jgi:hypothetical protein
VCISHFETFNVSHHIPGFTVCFSYFHRFSVLLPKTKS